MVNTLKYVPVQAIVSLLVPKLEFILQQVQNYCKLSRYWWQT